LRITAQLIEAATGAHLWAERYDRSPDDVFAVLDEVAQTIVATLVGRIEEAKLQQSLRKPTVSLAAYDFLLRGCVHLRGYAHDDNEQALRLFDKAVELDPRYAVAHAYSGVTSVMLDREANAGLVSRTILDAALNKALTGVRLDPQESRCHRFLVIIHLLRREFDLAEHHARLGLAINPNDADQMSVMGLVMTVRGRPKDALVWHEKAIRLNPFHPPFYDHGLGKALYLMRRYVEAIQAYTRIPGSNHSIRVQLAACLAYAGQIVEAKARVDALLAERPDLGAADYVQRDFVFERPKDREHFREGLIKAGLPA
jgi:tetratricopeptide (TPR) repeat protein